MFFKVVGMAAVSIAYLTALGFVEVTVEDWLYEKTKWTLPMCRLVSCGIIALFWWVTMFLGAFAAMGARV